MSDKVIEELKDFLSEHELVASCKAQEIANGCLEIIARHEATEPKDCGFTLATCPYERCSGITMRNPRATEPLAVLADRKGCRVRFAKREDGVWFFSCVGRHDRKQICGDNYYTAEAKARAFLMGLPDREGN